MKNFDDFYNEMRGKISSEFYLCPSEYTVLKRGFMLFYEEGMREMKETAISLLTEKMEKCNDAVPKTFYPSDKYKFAIKALKEIK